jgi:hypothetical protein
MIAATVCLHASLAGCGRDEAGAPAAVSTATALPAATRAPNPHQARFAGRAVTGKPAGLSRRPAGPLPKPSTRIDSRISGLKLDAADTQVSCASGEEGLAGCMDAYVVFCDGGTLYALDCSLFVDLVDAESATCGEIAGVIDCGWED